MRVEGSKTKRERKKKESNWTCCYPLSDFFFKLFSLFSSRSRPPLIKVPSFIYFPFPNYLPKTLSSPLLLHAFFSANSFMKAIRASTPSLGTEL